MAWNKKDHAQFERTIIKDYREQLHRIRMSGTLPEGYEESEPACVAKIALITLSEKFALTDQGKRHLKNVRHFV